MTDVRKSSRIEPIDMLRGLAALGVAVFHLCGRSTAPDFALAYVQLVTSVGGLRVPVFFVISGFVIAHSLRDRVITPRFAAYYAIRRSLRLDPAYWTAIAIGVGSTVTMKLILGQPYKLPGVGLLAAHAFYLQNLLNLGNLIPGLWTLCLDVQFYIFMLMLLAFSQKAHVPFGTLVFVLATLSLRYSVDGSSSDPQVLFNAYRSLIPNFSLFAVGIVAWLLQSGRISLSLWLVFQVIVITRLIIWFEPEILTAMLTGIVIVLWIRFQLPTIRAGLFMGKISYSLYLIHVPIGGLVFIGVRRITGTDAYNSLAWCVLAVTMSIAAATIMHKLVEQPSMRLAERLKRYSVGSGPSHQKM